MSEPAGRTYLTARGLTAGTIAELAPIYLTPTPDAAECEAYKAHLREPRTDNHGAPLKALDGLIIPYQTIAEPGKPFGRQRIITPTADLTSYYAKKGEEVPKFLSPAKARLKDQPGVHLFMLPHDAAKLGRSKDVLLLNEAEVKTAAVSQWARLLDDEQHQFVSLGAGGVSMFLPAPEWAALPLKNRPVYLFFDSDGFNKAEVMQAELKLTLACLLKGARAVLSCWWNPADGKGIDDYLAGQPCPLAALKALLAAAVSPFAKYAKPPVPGLLAYPLDTICDEIVKSPVKPFVLSLLAHALAQSYKDRGLTVVDVRRELDRARQRRREYERSQQPATQLQTEFDIPFTPLLPDNYDLSAGKLCFKDFPLCHQFVISKYVYTESPDTEDVYQLSFGPKTLLIPSDAQSNYKRLAGIFNRNREVLFDGSAKIIQQYISQFYLQNQAHIPCVPLYENTGWNRQGFFQLPDITSAHNNAVYPDDMTQIFKPHGDRAAHYALTEELLTQHKAGLFSVFGFAAPCVALLNLPQFVVVVYGKQGAGKTKGAEAAVSQYGDPDRLRFSMDSTKVGKEITFDLYRDLPILLDEINTASADGKKIAQNVIETIYGYSQAKGRTRSNVHLKHQHQANYRGILFMTAETSLESIFHNLQNMRVGGAYRRSLEIPVLDKQELWTLAPAKDQSHTQFLTRLHNQMRQHYGFVGLDWLTHLADEDVRARLAFEYDVALGLLVEKGYGNLEGTEKLAALVFAVMKELEFFLNLSGSPITTNLSPFLHAILERQQRQIDEQITDETEKFKDRIQHFIAMHLTSFDGLCPARAVMAQVFGKVWYTDTQTHIKLFAGTFKDFCCEYGFERDILLPELERKGILRKDGKLPYKQDSMAGAKGKAYYFVFDSQETGVLNDLSPTPGADSRRPAGRDSGAAVATAAPPKTTRPTRKT